MRHLDRARRAASLARGRGGRIVLAAALAAALAGCAGDGPILPAAAVNSGAAPSSSSSFPTTDPELQFVASLPTPRGGGGDDQLVAGDVLQMDVFGVDKLSRPLQVDSRGWVTFPLIGQLRAAGKSVTTLEREAAAAYGRNYLRSPSVTITLKESPSRKVVVDGEVTRSGVFPVTSRTTLMEAIAQAGGFNQVADQTKVFVYRTADGRKYVANYDVSQVREGKIVNPALYGGDVVVVFSSTTRIAWQNVKDFAGVARNVVGGALIK